MENISMELICLIRIVVAGICGTVVGLERKNRSKEAGIRTHFVVACGAAIIMVISKYAFFDVTGGEFASEVRLDPSRVASTIASGIGFLGAGMIFVHKGSITGLTTAAGIWATSGIGMAIGAGMYVLGVGATIVILCAQLLLHIDFHRNRNARMKVWKIKNVTENGFQMSLASELKKHNIEILTSAVEVNDDDSKNYTFTIVLPKTITEEEVIGLIAYKSSIAPGA